MVRCSIFYDNEKKEQFFMVRGDERYARSTKTILEYVSAVDDVSHFDCTLSVNVLRDTGEGSIVIYDNDVLTSVLVYDETTSTYVEMDSIPWSSLLNGLTFKVANLTYDVSHNFTAKYIGNKSCSPSTSSIVTVNRPDLNRTEAVISVGSKVQYVPNTTITKTITLSNDLLASYNANQNIVVKYDDTVIDTVTTDENGEASVSIPSGNAGLHTITYDYDGSSHLTTKIVTQDVSVGYHVEVIEYPPIAVVGNDFTITAKITDWFGNLHSPKLNGTGILDEIVVFFHKNNSYVTSYSGFTIISTGIVSKTIPASHIGQYDFDSVGISLDKYTQSPYRSYSSEPIPITHVEIESLSLSTSSLDVAKNETMLISANINQQIANVPVTLSRVKEFVGEYLSDKSYEVLSSETIYTNSEGVATKQYESQGGGYYEYRAECGDKTSNIVDFPDYYTYWNKREEDYRRGISPTIRYGDIIDLNSAFRFYSDDRGRGVMLYPALFSDKRPWSLYIGTVSSNSIIYVSNSGSDFDGIVGHQYINGIIVLYWDGTSLHLECYDDASLIFSKTIPNGDYTSPYLFIAGSATFQFTFRELLFSWSDE